MTYAMTRPAQGGCADARRAGPIIRSRSLSPTRSASAACQQHVGLQCPRSNAQPSDTYESIPSHGNVMRSRSLNTSELEVEKRRHRVRLQYHDEGLRARFCENARAMIDMAQHETKGSPTSIFMAKKALRYRGVLNRMEQVDPQDPCFDVSQFLGVEWCKTLEEPVGPDAGDDSSRLVA